MEAALRQAKSLHDGTRLRVLYAHLRNDQKVAIEIHRSRPLETAVPGRECPNGQPPGIRLGNPLGPVDLSIGHVKIRPQTPRLIGKAERSHRIDSDEIYRLLESEVIDDANLFAERPQQGKPTTTTIDHTALCRDKTPTNASSK